MLEEVLQPRRLIGRALVEAGLATIGGRPWRKLGDALDRTGRRPGVNAE
jgi:hypothetical protein